LGRIDFGDQTIEQEFGDIKVNIDNLRKLCEEYKWNIGTLVMITTLKIH
jgi:hypothetical protein